MRRQPVGGGHHRCHLRGHGGAEDQVGELACAQHSRLRRYQAPNAAPSLNIQPGNPRPGLSSCTCAARATTPADGATAILLYPSAARPCHSQSSTIPIAPGLSLEAAGNSIHPQSLPPIPPACRPRRPYHSLPVPPPPVAIATTTTQRRRRHHVPSITSCILASNTQT